MISEDFGAWRGSPGFGLGVGGDPFGLRLRLRLRLLGALFSETSLPFRGRTFFAGVLFGRTFSENSNLANFFWHTFSGNLQPSNGSLKRSLGRF